MPDDWLDRDLQDIAMLAPLQEVRMPLFEEKGVRVLVKREDLLHPLVGGNKIYKLHGFLNDYRQQQLSMPIATFGGAYSNHILALAAAGKLLGIETLGVIRGEQAKQLSATLKDAQSLGMKLHFVSRSDYRTRYDKPYVQTLDKLLGCCYWIPEGGSGYAGAKGGISLAKGLLRVVREPVDGVFHACGTGSTFAGLVAGLEESGVSAFGVSVLKGAGRQREDIKSQLADFGVSSARWTLLDQYHCGGYAKYPQELADFVSEFEHGNRFLLDPVYTSKVFMAIFDLIKNNFFARGSLLIAVHSGGIQGRRGFGLGSNLECLQT